MEESFLQDNVSTGTTIMAFKYKEGIMFAADSRTSSGQFVSCYYSDKITRLTDNILCCRAGNAAHTKYLQRICTRETKKLAAIEKTQPSISKMAHMLGSIIYDNSDKISAAFIVGGYDQGFELYKIVPDGTVIPTDIEISGSGSAFIYGFMDKLYKPNMEFKDALDFAVTMVRLAIKRDNSSGGVVRIATMDSEAVVKRYLLEGDKVFME
ncbi:Proteasome [Ecytonucleospora hepatopenaei]|uniref:proteasome endopeptidase complex n=1 Tax=Ecytonucleospora hepatopenaei TaxID=646526 RepID=A0A1W0E638_9MICR|nr:Proteasome [Ecytonucleospora hepatopenaei]